MSDVKVGDWVRLTGSSWVDYEDEGIGVGLQVRITEIDANGIWAGDAGTVGNARGLYSAENPEASGDYAVELVVPYEHIHNGTDWGFHSGFSRNVDRVLADVGELLKEKNRSYGDSALNPVRVFSKADRLEQLYVRLDDKIARVKNGHEFAGDDTIRDMCGYLVLILIARESE